MDKQGKGFLKDQNSNRANGLVIDNLDSNRILQDIKHSPLTKESVSIASSPGSPSPRTNFLGVTFDLHCLHVKESVCVRVCVCVTDCSIDGQKMVLYIPITKPLKIFCF